MFYCGFESKTKPCSTILFGPPIRLCAPSTRNRLPKPLIIGFILVPKKQLRAWTDFTSSCVGHEWFRLQSTYICMGLLKAFLSNLGSKCSFWEWKSMFVRKFVVKFRWDILFCLNLWQIPWIEKNFIKCHEVLPRFLGHLRSFHNFAIFFSVRICWPLIRSIHLGDEIAWCAHRLIVVVNSGAFSGCFSLQHSNVPCARRSFLPPPLLALYSKRTQLQFCGVVDD